MGWLELPTASKADVLFHCQGLRHSFALTLLSHSLSYPYAKKTSPVLQQQHIPAGKGESKAMASTSTLPLGWCWWLGWKHWAVLGVSSKAGAMAGGRKHAAGSRKLAAAPPGIPAHWKPKSHFLRCAGSVYAPSSACRRAGWTPRSQGWEQSDA